MGDVVDFNGYTRLDIEPDKVLEGAIGKLDVCLIIGRTKEGELYNASNIANMSEIVFMVEKLKIDMIMGNYQE